MTYEHGVWLMGSARNGIKYVNAEDKEMYENGRFNQRCAYTL